MKKICLSLIALVAIACSSHAQTNTFPTTGNVGIGTLTPGYPFVVDKSNSGAVVGYFNNSNATNGYGVLISTNANDATRYALQAIGGGGGLTVLSNGNVGIGTTNPAYRFQVNTGIDQNLQIRPYTFGSSGIFINAANDLNNVSIPLEFGASSFSFNIGNVGIGTTSTGFKLQVQTTGGGPQISVLSPVTSNAGVDYQTTLGHWTMGVGLGRAADVFNLRNETTGAEVLTVNNNGYVGIGTTSPIEKLDVNGALTFSGTTAGYATASNRGMLDYISNTVRLLGFGADASTYPAFQIYQAKANNTDGRVALQILNNGYVGIGTTNPNATLTVNGDFNVVNGGNQFSYNGRADVILVYPDRGSGGRAIVHDTGNRLTLNFGGDFTGGTSIGTNVYFSENTTGTSYIYGGNFAIGTSDTKGYKFAVAGNAIAESMTVKLQANWPDVVFKKDYTLMPLSDVKTYIDKNQHLPEIPAAAEVEKDGVNLGEMNRLLVKKVEELTLYLIEKDRQEKSQQQQIDELKKQVEALVASRKIQ